VNATRQVEAAWLQKLAHAHDVPILDLMCDARGFARTAAQHNLGGGVADDAELVAEAVGAMLEGDLTPDEMLAPEEVGKSDKRTTLPVEADEDADAEPGDDADAQQGPRVVRPKEAESVTVMFGESEIKVRRAVTVLSRHCSASEQ
jgi:hypothetical protein